MWRRERKRVRQEVRRTIRRLLYKYKERMMRGWSKAAAGAVQRKGRLERCIGSKINCLECGGLNKKEASKRVSGFRCEQVGTINQDWK